MPTILGTCKFARVFEHNKDTKYDDNGTYTVDLYVEPSEIAKIKKLGIPLKHSEEGDFLKLKRKHAYFKEGELVTLGPPPVVGPDGKTPFTENIGNGSKVAAMVSLFESKGTRSLKLQALQVIDHVPYDSGPKREPGALFPNMTKDSGTGEDTETVS